MKQGAESWISRPGAILCSAAHSALAQDHGSHGGAGDGLKIGASVEKTCATCRYWGGMRRLSADKSEVTSQSMGWCNNPDSPNHAKLTQADHQMKKPGIWEKWSILP
jgi:hypothetical protein